MKQSFSDAYSHCKSRWRFDSVATIAFGSVTVCIKLSKCLVSVARENFMHHTTMVFRNARLSLSSGEVTSRSFCKLQQFKVLTIVRTIQKVQKFRHHLHSNCLHESVSSASPHCLPNPNLQRHTLFSPPAVLRPWVSAFSPPGMLGPAPPLPHI